MVGVMTGPWRTPRRSVAGAAATVLVLLCLIASSLVPAVAWGAVNAGPAHSGVTNASHAHSSAENTRHAHSGIANADHANTGSGQVWSQRDAGADVSSLPPQTGVAREHHAPSLWPSRGGFHDALAYQALMTPPAPDTDAFRHPQRPAHRTAGPRSPPGA